LSQWRESGKRDISEWQGRWDKLLKVTGSGWNQSPRRLPRMFVRGVSCRPDTNRARTADSSHAHRAVRNAILLLQCSSIMTRLIHWGAWLTVLYSPYSSKLT